MKADPKLDSRLREIVLRHVVVGGHPDAMAIAREAYALDRAPGMTLERTVWRGDASREESLEIDRWIRNAPDDVMERLLGDVLNVTSEDGQALLTRVWNDANDDLDGLLDGRVRGSGDDMPTYHWGEGERKALRRAIAHLRPGYLDADPGQGSLL